MECDFSRRQTIHGLGLLMFGAGVGPGVLATPAFASELDDARDSGAIGERPDGLIGAVSPDAPAHILSLVDNVNRARLESYQQLAEREGTRLEAVQAVAGGQVEKAVRNGWYVMDPNGSWRKR